MSVKQIFRFKYLEYILADYLRDGDDVEIPPRRALVIRGKMLALRFVHGLIT